MATIDTRLLWRRVGVVDAEIYKLEAESAPRARLAPLWRERRRLVTQAGRFMRAPILGALPDDLPPQAA